VVYGFDIMFNIIMLTCNAFSVLPPISKLVSPECQVRVYSGRGSGQVRTKTDEGRGQRFGQRLVQDGVATDWIQRQGQRALIPCVGSGQVETEMETDKGTGVVT